MYYVMSDIHGCYNQLVQALNHWDSEKEHLIIIGDLIDRGPDSLKVVRELMKLRKDFPDNVTVLKGNHEEMLLAWLKDTPRELLESYYNTSHEETFKSFMGIERYRKSSRKQRPLDLLYNNKEELNFMNSLPLFLEKENIIFVHAGIDLNAEDWREKTENMLWVRNEFIYAKKSPEKRIFFGHTPTSYIHNDREDNNVWISPDGMKVGIDGGVSMKGQLNALKVNEKGDIIETLIFNS